MFIDSHFHSLVMANKGMDVHTLLAKAVETGVGRAIDIGIHPEDTEKRLALTGSYPWIRHSAGIYPGASAPGNDIPYLLSYLEKQLAGGRISAVGEMGIDLHWNYAPAEVQIDLLSRQIDLANQYKLPVIIHNREGDAPLLDALEKNQPIAGGIMHCFSSGPETAQRCIDSGLYISFAGNITYDRSNSIRNTALSIPAERLLIETDSPYLSPVPVRGKQNHPARIQYTYSYIADLLRIDNKKLEVIVEKNFRRLFSEPRV